MTLPKKKGYKNNGFNVDEKLFATDEDENGAIDSERISKEIVVNIVRVAANHFIVVVVY
jgi:hypothetical protein